VSQSTQGPAPGEVTKLLAAIRQEDASAMDRLMTLVYDELRAVARRQLRRCRPGQTLDTTALVHEAYLRLVDQAGASWQDRAHFLSVAGVAMRQILVDAAHRRTAKKRAGEYLRISFDELTSRAMDCAPPCRGVGQFLTASSSSSQPSKSRVTFFLDPGQR
jgi:RNA polymerase sigma factor (TIGR02999 family)